MFWGNDMGRDCGKNLVSVCFSVREAPWANTFTKYTLLILLKLMFVFSHLLLTGLVEFTVCRIVKELLVKVVYMFNSR